MSVENAIQDMLKYQDFCVLVEDVDKEHGLVEGVTLFISGSQGVPQDEEDIYNLRLKMIVCKVEDSHVVTDKLYLVDPKSLEKIPEEVSEVLVEILNEDFADKAKETEEKTDEAIN